MSRNELRMAAPIEVIWGVLADPRQYDDFVVGTKRIRDFDDTWPEPGARLHHTIGVGPAKLRDCTEILECNRPSTLLMHAAMRPLAVNEVRFTLQPITAEETSVTVIERPLRGPARAVWNPVLDALMGLRNKLLLQRLQRLVERGEPAARQT